jgi:hypothetical protein
MSSAPTLGSQSLEHGKDRPGILGVPAELPFRFLDLEPELRNQIYEQTFFAEAQTSFSGLAPHSLTRVNQQVRRESLALYYPSVETLEIPLYNEKNRAHVREWLAKSSLQHYPVLPDIGFATTANLSLQQFPKTVRLIIHFKRLIVNPAQEVERDLSSRVPTREEPDVNRAAYLTAHSRCLGLSSIARETDRYNWFIGRRSQPFTDAINSRETWTIRHIDILAADHPPRFTRLLCLWVSKFARRKEGSIDWGEAEVRELVGFIEFISQSSGCDASIAEQRETYLRGLFR